MAWVDPGAVRGAELDERRLVVVLSSGADSPQMRAVQVVVAPAGVDIADLGIEVPLGVWEGFPAGGVVRFGFPRPGFVPCTWLVSWPSDDLIERVGVVSSTTLSQIEDAWRLATQPRAWSADTGARFSEIRDALTRHPHPEAVDP